MTKPTILIADDIDDYRALVVEFLEENQYSVVGVRTIPEARRALESGLVDLAIIDIRMEPDKDPNDISGLKLAVEVAPQIPKIIITAFPTPDLVRTALRRIGGRLPAAVDFLDKAEGFGAILDSIKKLLPLRDIFVVHGHHDAARLEVKGFLTQLHLNPIILQDMPNGGQVIIEKLEQASKVTYAIVLLTPDDLCELKNDGGKLEPRARQNVILELGYFIGKLGRDRVCALYIEGVVLPSDIHGLVWIKLDRDGAWKIALARELRAAGIFFDPNDIL